MAPAARAEVGPQAELRNAAIVISTEMAKALDLIYTSGSEMFLAYFFSSTENTGLRAKKRTGACLS